MLLHSEQDLDQSRVIALLIQPPHHLIPLPQPSLIYSTPGRALLPPPAPQGRAQAGYERTLWAAGALMANNGILTTEHTERTELCRFSLCPLCPLWFFNGYSGYFRTSPWKKIVF